MITFRITGADRTIGELSEIEKRLETNIDKGVNQTGSVGETIGKSFLSSHIFTGNAYRSWRWQDTGKFQAMVSYLNAGMPHPTGLRSEAYFEALEYGRRGYVGSPNRIAVGTSGAYSYPHYNIGPASGAYIVTNTSQTLEPVFIQIMNEAVGSAL